MFVKMVVSCLRNAHFWSSRLCRATTSLTWPSCFKLSSNIKTMRFAHTKRILLKPNLCFQMGSLSLSLSSLPPVGRRGRIEVFVVMITVFCYAFFSELAAPEICLFYIYNFYIKSVTLRLHKTHIHIIARAPRRLRHPPLWGVWAVLKPSWGRKIQARRFVDLKKKNVLFALLVSLNNV